MVAQGIIGGQLYNGDYSLYKTHKNMAKVVNAGYFTGAALSLFSPPPLVNKKTKRVQFNKGTQIFIQYSFFSNGCN